MRHECVSCGTFIVRSATSDPYLCEECEMLLEGARQEKYLLEMY